MSDVLNRTLAALEMPDKSMEEAALTKLREQARPAGSLGVLEGLSARLASIAGTLDVHLKKKVIVTCAGDHGIVEEGVSLFPADVTPMMVYNFVKGGASVNVLARHAGAEVMVADLGVNHAF
ncbi:MAG: nicotinate-nucleotide--dimethylbenzimidazole phosphoribosyltransferase, partial [Lentisphaerae bacterium]|nr:nicotinate-nucleotide--dimethylbenzimidazole phosphoribosyltransferase [Lentisphaerota bacterium]